MNRPSTAAAAIARRTDDPAAPGAWRDDLVAGMLVSLVALPLCLGISLASGFPPVAGIFTAVIGGLVATWCGSAPLTIKGPAAGLIVIALGAVTELGQGDPAGGYRRALATIAVAGVLQVGLARLRAGALGDFFPTAVVQGMLAAIGVIIFGKQVHVMLGVRPDAATHLGLLAEIPRSVARMNPPIAALGATSLALLFALPRLRSPWVRRVPPPLVALAVAVAMGRWYGIEGAPHFHHPAGGPTSNAPLLLQLPGSLAAALTRPDFDALLTGTGIKFVVMFTLVGSVESMLSARAVDAIDPWRRRSDLDADLLATGVGNALAGLVGGLPMISEVVRSSANVSHGGRTRRANFFHGLFLLLLVGAAPSLLARIPLAALAAMLVYIGARLASPRALVHTLRIGREQLAIFGATLAGTLAVDILVGVALGVAVKVALNLAWGMRPRDLIAPTVAVEDRGAEATVRVSGAAVFTNVVALRRRVDRLAAQRVVIDVSAARLIDHSAMERLAEMRAAWSEEGREIVIRGLDALRAVSSHPLAARRGDGRP